MPRPWLYSRELGRHPPASSLMDLDVEHPPDMEWMHHVKAEYYFQKLARIGEFYACVYFRCCVSSLSSIKEERGLKVLFWQVICKEDIGSRARIRVRQVGCQGAKLEKGITLRVAPVWAVCH